MLNLGDDNDYVDDKPYHDKPYRNPVAKKQKDKKKVLGSFQRRVGYQDIALDENGFPIKTIRLESDEGFVEVNKPTHRRPEKSLKERRRAEKGTHRSALRDLNRIWEEAESHPDFED